VLDAHRLDVVLAAIRQHAGFRGWRLVAAHVRTTHVHVVVAGEDTPERMMNELKAYASRALNRAGIDPAGRQRWARHGSTRWLATDESAHGAVRYSIDEQGEKMAAYEDPGEPRPPGSG
jgi:REP element-mobilizing transposase RayT